MTMRGPFPGKVLSVQGGDNGVGPASQLSYTVQVPIPKEANKTFLGVTPQAWRWPDTIDTNGAALVGKVVACYIVGQLLVADFVEPPAFGPC